MHALVVPIPDQTVSGATDRRRGHGSEFIRQLTHRFTVQLPHAKEKLTLLVPVIIRVELPSLRNLSQFGFGSAIPRDIDPSSCNKFAPSPNALRIKS
jgi:hypothetical protein